MMAGITFMYISVASPNSIRGRDKWPCTDDRFCDALRWADCSQTRVLNKHRRTVCWGNMCYGRDGVYDGCWCLVTLCAD